MDQKAQRTAILLGATGLIGGHCLNMLLNHTGYAKVVTLGRRKTTLDNPKLEQHVIDFDKIIASGELPAQGTDLYCCLGTTMKQARSKGAFYKVDFTYTFEMAKLAADTGVKQCLLVSALGADPHSMIFYNRVKGEVEEAVKRLPFEAIHIFQPSLLLGERKENRLGERMGEGIMQLLRPVMIGGLRKYRAIEAKVVATAMIKAALARKPGIHVHLSDKIQAMTGDKAAV